MSPSARLYAAVLLVGAWLGLLLFGVALGGAVHVVLAAALAVAPWRELLAAPPPAVSGRAGAGDDPPSRGAGDRPSAAS